MLSIDDPVRLGRRVGNREPIDLAFGSVTFTPAVGWTVLSSTSLPPDDDHAVGWVELVDDAVSVWVRSRPYDGSPEELLEQVCGSDDSTVPPPGVAVDRRAFTGRAGVQGLTACRTGSDDDYLVAVLCVRSTSDGWTLGIEFVAEGVDGALAQRADVLHEMIASIGP